MALSLFYLYPIYQVSLLRNLEAIIINEKKKQKYQVIFICIAILYKMIRFLWYLRDDIRNNYAPFGPLSMILFVNETLG